MSVKIRLQRHGRKKQAYYFVVAADSRSPRDGKFIERLGSYNPNTNPATIEIDSDKALKWLQNGAQPTDTCHRILSYTGVLYRKHLARGVTKGVVTEEAAEAKLAAWLEAKTGKINDKSAALRNKADAEIKAKFKAETEASEKKAAAIAAKIAAADASANPEVAEETETTVDSAPADAPAEVVVEEAPAPVAEETPAPVEETPAPEVVAETPAEEAPAAPAEEVEEKKEETPE